MEDMLSFIRSASHVSIESNSGILKILLWLLLLVDGVGGASEMIPDSLDIASF